MHALLATLGTDGDILPYAALGRALLRRGHRVTLVTSDKYAPLAAACGLEFVSLLDQSEIDAALGHPDFWHPLKGPRLAARWSVDQLERHYRLLREVCGSGGPDVVLIASPGVLPARVLEEQGHVPLVSIVLQPWMIQSRHEPPVMPAGLTLPRGMPLAVGTLYWRAIDVVGALMIGRHLNRLRRGLGMRPVRRVFQWWLSPRRVLGLFPAWYGPPQPDWPPQVRLFGFALFDGANSPSGRGQGEGEARVQGDHAIEDESPTAALAEGRPVVFTFGTGMAHAAGLFAACAQACRIVGRRGVFLTRYGGQVPSPLPPWVRHARFAPLTELLPRCAAIVHHGGVGTTAAALAAGVPQLLLPNGFDQFDNAARVRRLGAGDWLPSGPRRRMAAHIAAALARLLGSASVAESCRRAKGYAIADGDALVRAAEEVESSCDPPHP
jgi:rhamnosyltransferase subunit B